MKEDLYSHKTKKRLVYTNRFFVLNIIETDFKDSPKTF